jgi:hypothetical protein
VASLIGGPPVNTVPVAHEGDKTSPAEDWPAWTDEDSWELGPDPADAKWAAENLNDDWHADEAVPDDCYDRRAEEFQARDLYERGILPF